MSNDPFLFGGIRPRAGNPRSGSRLDRLPVTAVEGCEVGRMSGSGLGRKPTLLPVIKFRLVTVDKKITVCVSRDPIHFNSCREPVFTTL